MKRYVRHPGAADTQIDAESFLTDPADAKVFYLNETGTGLWRLLAEPHSLEAIATIYENAFPDVDRAQLQDDLDAVLQDLCRRDLVVEA